MNKTKIVILAATLAVLAAVAVAGATYAQTLSQPTYAPSTGTYVQAPQAAGTGFGGARCPVLGGYASSYGTQNGYVAQPRYGMGGGMMGRLGW